MAEGGRVGKSWRVRDAIGDRVPEANTTACACSTTCKHQQFSCQPDVSFHASILNVYINQTKRREWMGEGAGGANRNHEKKQEETQQHRISHIMGKAFKKKCGDTVVGLHGCGREVRTGDSISP